MLERTLEKGSKTRTSQMNPLNLISHSTSAISPRGTTGALLENPALGIHPQLQRKQSYMQGPLVEPVFTTIPREKPVHRSGSRRKQTAPRSEQRSERSHGSPDPDGERLAVFSLRFYCWSEHAWNQSAAVPCNSGNALTVLTHRVLNDVMKLGVTSSTCHFRLIWSFLRQFSHHMIWRAEPSSSQTFSGPIM